MGTHPSLKTQPTLADLQAYVEAVVKHRGFADDSVQHDFIMLVEEVGELAKALRKWNGDSIATDSTTTSVEHEVADVLWMLLGVCNRLGVNLEEAFRAKDDKNKQRTWQK